MSACPRVCVLVLDDYHAIRGEAVHDFLSELIRHWPQRLHLVLISRSNPPLPLANLRAKRPSHRDPCRDLRFTPEEWPRSWARLLAAPLSPSAVALLDQRIEGWIAGLRLATLSLARRSRRRNRAGRPVGHRCRDCRLPGGRGPVAPDRLRSEISAGDLHPGSVLRRAVRMRPGGVAASDDSPATSRPAFSGWSACNLFVIPLDNEREWYRYHHLFQELLQRRLLAEVGPEQVTELHRRAAAWFAGQGLIDEALRHALAADDLDLAARLMVEGLCDVLNREDRATLDRWLRLLPEEFVQRRPWLLIMRALAFQFSWQLPAVWKLLGQIEALLDEGGAAAPALAGRERLDDPHDPPVLRGLIAVLRGQEAFTNGQAARAIACCEEALALLPERWALWARRRSALLGHEHASQRP